jgi:5S rRNA maturation endonuclease (ribonuclease M5)
MIRINEAIIVEGIYDKIKLSRFIDGVIFVTGGFSVIKNKLPFRFFVSISRQGRYNY